MNHVYLALGAVVVIALVVGWALRRFGSPWGSRVTLAANTVLRIVVGCVFAATAVRAAERGGVFFVALAVLLFILALASFAIAGIIVWGIAKYGVDDEKD